MKNNFYIFLDIDGVFNHIKWFKKCLIESLEKQGFHLFFCPTNIEIFNKLLEYYRNNNFNPKIVVTSTWRLSENDFSVCKRMLLKYGLNYNDEFDKTELKPRGIRGRQILNYMDKNNIKENFIIIDDKSKYIETYFNKKDIILTSGLFGCGLTNNNVENYIQNREQNKNF